MKTIPNLILKFLLFFFFITQGISSLHLAAQQILPKYQHPIKFEYDNEKEGEVIVVYQYDDNNKQPHYIEKSSNLKIDFNGLEEGILSVYFLKFKSTERKNVRRKKFRENFKLVVPKKCIKTTGNIALSSSYKKIDASYDIFEINESISDRQIDFVIKKNGKGSIKINFGAIFKDLKISEWTCGGGGDINFNFEAIGIKEVPIDYSALDWGEHQKGTIIDWAAHLNKYPKSDYKNLATNLIKNEYGKKEFSTIQIDTDQADRNFIDFCKKYAIYNSDSGNYITRAENRIKKRKELRKVPIIEPIVPKAPCILAWAKIRKSSNPKDYENYLKEYESSSSPCESYFEIAKEKISELQPLELEQKKEVDEKGYSVIFIKNAINPKFKDISIDDGLIVKTERLKDENILLVKHDLGGQYELYVEDEYGKKDSISFDNNLVAGMKADSASLRFTFEKGSKPYQLKFINEQNGTIVFSKDTIQNNGWEIPISTLQKKGISGNILIQASDNDSWKPKKMGTVFIAPLNKNTFTKYWIIGISALAILLGGIFFFLFWKKRKKKHTYYEEMG